VRTMRTTSLAKVTSPGQWQRRSRDHSNPAHGSVALEFHRAGLGLLDQFDAAWPDQDLFATRNLQLAVAAEGQTEVTLRTPQDEATKAQREAIEAQRKAADASMTGAKATEKAAVAMERNAKLMLWSSDVRGNFSSRLCGLGILFVLECSASEVGRR
jgi:hypothetical protein